MIAPRLAISNVRTIVIWLSDNDVKRDNRKLQAKLNRTSSVMILFFLQAGTKIAMNMPYKATDKALTILRGRTLPMRMPNAVPKAQQGEAKQIAPYMYTGST